MLGEKLIMTAYLFYAVTFLSLLSSSANSLQFPFVNPTLFSPELNIFNSIFEERDGDRKKFLVRNVPGYGSCLFYSLASCITFDRCFQHILFTTHRMKNFVNKLRMKAVEELQNNHNPDRSFYLDNNQQMSVRDVLKAAAENVNLKENEYLNEMQLSKTWGGGPEIVALSNYFKRPIHVYELCTYTRVHFNPLRILNLKSLFQLEHKFKLSLCAKFGSPAFDNENNAPYCILCADGRFPHIFPGFHKKKGDHFLALFPVKEIDMNKHYHNYYRNNDNHDKSSTSSIKNKQNNRKFGLIKTNLRSGKLFSSDPKKQNIKYIYEYPPFNEQNVDIENIITEEKSNENNVNNTSDETTQDDINLSSNIFEI